MPKFYVCTEAFAVTLNDGDHWFKVGQRVHESNAVFQPSTEDPEGLSARNRMSKMFLAEDAEPAGRGPGRPRKAEAVA